MSAIDTFKAAVEAELAEEVKAASPDVVGFDFTSLIALLLPLLLDALTGLLDNCLSASARQEAIVERLTEKSVFKAFVIRRKLRTLDCPQEQVAPCCNAVVKVLDRMDEPAAAQLVAEVKAGLTEWSFV